MEMTQELGLSAVFFTLVFFTSVGFMMHIPLVNQGRKAVIQYLSLGRTDPKYNRDDAGGVSGGTVRNVAPG